MPTPRNFWEDLFPAPAPEGERQGVQVKLRLLRRRGQPFLLLPGQPRCAAATLSLYPAQTGRARAVRTIWRWLVRASTPIGTESVALTVSPEDPFVRCLVSLTGEREGGLPVFGVLAGNPASKGQRFLLLVFDANQRPVAVVKAGLSEQARALIEQETSFLAAVPEQTAAIPRLRAQFQSPRLRALALDFFAGDSPRPRDEGALPSLLSSWVNPKRAIGLSEAPDWARLANAASARELFSVLAGRLQGRTIHAAICHGDFAPWNIKVSDGAWTALDWERGELTGIPGWDWFHYVIQSAILVARMPTPALTQRVEGLLGSAAFQQYAAQSGIEGCERELVLAYLLQMVEVIKPSEGLAPARELMHALQAHWRIG